MRTLASHHETTFRTWCDAREPELQRIAHLLTGDLRTARAHVRDSLAVALAAGGEREADLDPVARRALVAAVVSRRDSVAGEDSGLAVSTVDHVDPDPRQRVAWDFLATLGPTRRAAVVLRLHGRCEDREAADLIGIGPAAVAIEVDAALDDLAAMLVLPAPEVEALAVATLDARAEATPVVPTSYAAVRGALRHRRRRRARAGTLLGAAALVGVMVPVVAFSGGGLPTAPRPTPPTPSGFTGFQPSDRVPPPWVLPPGTQVLRRDLETRCSSPKEEDFRSTTTIRSGCRTYVTR